MDIGEEQNVFYDVIAWRADAVSGLARAYAGLKGRTAAPARAELLLMMKVLRNSIAPAKAPAITAVPVSKLSEFLTTRGPHAKPGDVGPRGDG